MFIKFKENDRNQKLSKFINQKFCIIVLNKVLKNLKKKITWIQETF